MPNLALQPRPGQRRSVGAAPPDFAAEVAALLAGTNGWAVDPSDSATLFTDTAGTTPVTTPGVSTIARINTKFGTTTYNWQQPTAASQYLWNGASMGLDGIDDLLATTAQTWSANMAARSCTWRAQVDDLSANRCVFSCSTATGTVVRYQLQVLTTGAISWATRRADADTQNNFVTSAGLITTGVPFTIQTTEDFAGTGAVEIFLNGSSVLTATMGGTIGNSESTNSARCRFGLNTSNTLTDWFRNKHAGGIWAPTLHNAAARASCKGFVERFAL